MGPHLNNALIGAGKGATRGAMPDPRARLVIVIAEETSDSSDGPAVVVHDLPAVGTAGR